jgi:hypothetical protein
VLFEKKKEKARFRGALREKERKGIASSLVVTQTETRTSRQKEKANASSLVVIRT